MLSGTAIIPPGTVESESAILIETQCAQVTLANRLRAAIRTEQ